MRLCVITAQSADENTDFTHILKLMYESVMQRFRNKKLETSCLCF